MSDDDEAPDWKLVAKRGGLRMAVVSPALAARDHVSMHEDATITTTVYPDGGEPFALDFVSAIALRHFIEEMQPYDLELCVISDRDAQELDAMIFRGTLH